MTEFSNNDRDIFLIKLERMIDRGALMSRYSRTASLDIRDVYKKEFRDNTSRGKEFYKRVFLEYGDESVAELVTAQVGIQNISNIATKVIEEARVGLSFLEKSSRYVRYDKKVDGRFLFAEAGKIGITGNLADLYDDHCNSLFTMYSDIYSSMLERAKELYPVEDFYFYSSKEGGNVPYGELGDTSDREIADKSYRSSIRSAVLDELRFILPASTLTNMGISGNGRAFIGLIQKLQQYGTEETASIADRLYSELEPEFPELIDSALSGHGKEMVEFLKGRSELPSMEFQQEEKIPLVRLFNYDEAGKALNRVISLLYYENGTDLTSINSAVELIPREKKAEIISNLAGRRMNRRHKPGRPFETVNYLFEINTNYGAFRDLQRHRFISIERKPLDVRYGYDTPDIISRFPDIQNRYADLMEMTKKVHAEIRGRFGPKVAQYAVPYSFRYPVTAALNLNELTYFVELRSTPQAHYDLRNIAIQMYEQVRKVHPDLSGIIRFVDTAQYPLGRLSSEARKERKSKEL